MGMSIADNIDFLNEAKKLFEDIANNPKINETIKTYFIIESLETAIETMRKYQKLNKLKQECPFRTENSECNCTNEDCFIDDISDMCPFPKADYETRLKADMVAMLTDIQLEMESLRFGLPPRKYVVDECLDVIQQKIDALKDRDNTDE